MKVKITAYTCRLLYTCVKGVFMWIVPFPLIRTHAGFEPSS